MGVVPAAAVAVATWCAAAAGRAAPEWARSTCPLVVVFAGLAAGAAGAGRAEVDGRAAARQGRRRAHRRDGRRLRRPVPRSGGPPASTRPTIARLLPLAVVGLSRPVAGAERAALLPAAGRRHAARHRRRAGGVARSAVGGALVVDGRRPGRHQPADRGQRAPARRGGARPGAGGWRPRPPPCWPSSASSPPWPRRCSPRRPDEGGGSGTAGGAGRPSRSRRAPDVAVRRPPRRHRRPGRARRRLRAPGRASEADVWRATTYDHWDGESWSRAPDALALLDDDIVEPGHRRPRRARSVVERLGRVPGGDRPGPHRQRCCRPRPGRRTPPSSTAPCARARDASLYPSPASGPGRRLPRVQRRRPTPAPARSGPSATRRRRCPPTWPTPTSSCPQVAPRVRALAAEVAAGRKSTTYAKVRAVEALDRRPHRGHRRRQCGTCRAPTRWRRSCSRTDPGRPSGRPRAWSVMLRALGVPARMAVGFLPGTRTGPDEPFLVRSRDAHAWVEVWFPTVGWQRFDPTGLAPDPHASRVGLGPAAAVPPQPVAPPRRPRAGRGAGWLAWRGARWRRRRAALPWSTRFFERVERGGRGAGPADGGRRRRRSSTPAGWPPVSCPTPAWSRWASW